MVGHLIRVQSAADFEGGELIPGVPRLGADQVARDAPQETWMLRGPGGRIDGHGSLWWRGVVANGGQPTGIVGHYAARDAEAGEAMLGHLCRRLAAEGVTTVVGPADGGAWRPHRLVVERGTERSFLFDLSHPDSWPDHFRAAGFTPLAEYVSTVIDDLSEHDIRLQRAKARMVALGVRFRRFRLARVADELRAMHAVASAAAVGPLSAALPESVFLDVYGPLLAFLDPQFVLMAEHDGRLVGYVFSAPDLHERAWGKPERTLVIRTVVGLPDRVFAGLDAVLLAEAHRAGLDAGLERAIHALVLVSDATRARAAHWHGRPIRRYALFGRSLAAPGGGASISSMPTEPIRLPGHG